jgi:hypothetical protein
MTPAMVRVRRLTLGSALATLVVALALAAGAALAAPTAATVAALPAAQTVPASGPLSGTTGSIAVNAARGEREGAWIVARGARRVEARVEPGSLGAIGVELAWGHFVRVGGKLVADALLPWDGAAREAEQSNQPLYVRVKVPRSVAPGAYAGSVAVTVDGRALSVPLRVRVFPFTLPERGAPTSFHVSPATYLNTVARLFGFADHDERRASNAALFAFLAEYGLSPSSWGFGEPRTQAGYTSSPKWWLDSATNMVDAARAGFPAMRVPISSNRTAPGGWIAGLNPSNPESWCDYLRSVRGFWERQGWLGRTLPFLYAQDEPGLPGQRLVARQSKVLHTCFPGAKSLMTGNPEPSGANQFLSDGKGGDDLDIWVVLSRRYYGQFTSPKQTPSRARELASTIDRVRRSAQVWSYTYTAVMGTPGFSALEPLSNPRTFMLWNALEGLQGVLYGQGTTSYDAGGSPFASLSRSGDFVLLYPGKARPIPSARLEQIRDGLEDIAILDAVRRRGGAAAVRSVLGGAGLFSADRRAVRLACNLGCELRSPTRFSWPLWSRDATTASRIERAHLAALRLAR